MASPSPEQIIETQRQDWNRVAGGWEKWDRFFDEQMAFLNHRLVADARLRSGMRILDLGSGTGYPALLAAHIVGVTGNVVGIDLAEQMLDAARRKAAALGLSNITFRTGDVTTLPFETASFDAITTRFCLMFLPEIPKAVAEIARILKPDTWMAAAVWSAPEKNPYLKIPIDIIKQFIELPPPDPEAPGIFRLAKPGELAAMLQQLDLSTFPNKNSRRRSVCRGRRVLLQPHGHCRADSKSMGNWPSKGRSKATYHSHSGIARFSHRIADRSTDGCGAHAR